MHVQWRWLDIRSTSNTGLLDIRVGSVGDGRWRLRIMVNSPTTVTSQLMPLFVTKSQFRPRHIVHPEGGGATRLVCEQCGADYPYVNSPQPCSNCAVMKESGVMFFWRGRLYEWLWSDWGWGVKENGYWVGEPLKHPMPPGVTVTRFQSKQKAQAYVDRRVKRFWDEMNSPDAPHDAIFLEVGPYPTRPVQPARPDMAAMAGIFGGGPPGIGAKPGTLGRPPQKGLPKL